MRNIMERALKNNPNLVAATFHIEEVQAISRATRTPLFPFLNGRSRVTGSYGSQNAGQAPLNGSRRSESYDLTALLSWEIDLWRGNQAALDRVPQSGIQQDEIRTLIAAAQSFRAAMAETGVAMALIAYEKASKQAFREAADALNAHRKTGEIIAERSLFAAELDLTNSRRDRIQGADLSYRALVGS